MADWYDKVFSLKLLSINMVVWLTVTNRFDKDNPRSFYRIPKKPDHRRKSCIAAIKRVGPNGQQWEPTDHDRICFLHFITGMSLIVLNICKCLKWNVFNRWNHHDMSVNLIIFVHCIVGSRSHRNNNDQCYECMSVITSCTSLINNHNIPTKYII